ncbi:peptidase C14, caspase domain-containing protein, partial [Vararia minispora EC-137]
SLLIGIDDYHRSSRFPKLKGCVSDAINVRNFLVKDLLVSEDRIKTLLNHEATHEGIITAVKNLALDSSIAKGDPILIYFAGHGSTVTSPPEWTGGPKIQVLVPYDGNADDGAGTNLIPDFQFGRLLREIASRKGDNITVVLDCCHAASGTRG